MREASRGLRPAVGARGARGRPRGAAGAAGRSRNRERDRSGARRSIAWAPVVAHWPRPSWNPLPARRGSTPCTARWWRAAELPAAASRRRSSSLCVRPGRAAPGGSCPQYRPRSNDRPLRERAVRAAGDAHRHHRAGRLARSHSGDHLRGQPPPLVCRTSIPHELHRRARPRPRGLLRWTWCLSADTGLRVSRDANGAGGSRASELAAGACIPVRRRDPVGTRAVRRLCGARAHPFVGAVGGGCRTGYSVRPDRCGHWSPCRCLGRRGSRRAPACPGGDSRSGRRQRWLVVAGFAVRSSELGSEPAPAGQLPLRHRHPRRLRLG